MKYLNIDSINCSLTSKHYCLITCITSFQSLICDVTSSYSYIHVGLN